MRCTNSQILDEGPAPVWGVGASNSPDYVESGITPIPSGVSTVNVQFATEKISAVYTVLELTVENVVDGYPLFIAALVRTRRTTGFTAILSGATDSANYSLRWNTVVTQA